MPNLRLDDAHGDGGRNMNKPYRELALVPMVAEPVQLFPYYHPNALCPCPKCGASDIDNNTRPNRRHCTGRRIGLCHSGCRETREHFHVKCWKCGWRALMAPKDATA